VGAVVIIRGTGFSTTPSQNTVAFNGVAATVSAASTTRLTVSVPATATTGTISVTTPSGFATSVASFTVIAVTAAPTITSFTPTIGVVATSVTVTGTNFQTTPSSNNLRSTVIWPRSLRPPPHRLALQYRLARPRATSPSLRHTEKRPALISSSCPHPARPYPTWPSPVLS